MCIWDEPDGVTVAIARPEALFGMVGNSDMAPVAPEADQRLRRALEAL